jgi:hypothetical protein
MVLSDRDKQLEERRRLAGQEVRCVVLFQSEKSRGEPLFLLCSASLSSGWPSCGSRIG